MAFTIQTIYHHIFKRWRKRRFVLFLQTLRPSRADVLLDVGGYPAFWTGHPQPVKRIDCLNIHEIIWPANYSPGHTFRLLIGDGCSLDLANRSYDIGFSNSVIEHVGSWQRQQQFANELQRVAKSLWVQTPAYECPWEPHYMAPFFHYLPASVQRRLLRWCTPLGWIERLTQEQAAEMVANTRLLRKSEMLSLFPDCEIITERIGWLFPKSYIAVRKGAPPVMPSDWRKTR